MKKGLSQIKEFKFSRGANLILTSGLSILVFDVIYIIRAIFFTDGDARLRSIVLFPAWAECIFVSLVLVVGGALFYDYIVKRNSNDNNK